MDDEELHHLLRPLLIPSAASSATTSSHSGIIYRLTLVAFIGVVSIWANHEASKGYTISIVNDTVNSLPGVRFQLHYVSNDEATRILIKASQTIEDFLYPHFTNSIKKSITGVVFRLADANLTENVAVGSGSTTGSGQMFEINISQSVMEGKDFGRKMVVALRQGVARMWLWNGQGKAPKSLIDGIVAYLVNNLLCDSESTRRVESSEPTTTRWRSNDSGVVAEFLNLGEKRSPGFVRRLNQAMKDGWNDEIMERALGQPVWNL